MLPAVTYYYIACFYEFNPTFFPVAFYPSFMQTTFCLIWSYYLIWSYCLMILLAYMVHFAMNAWNTYRWYSKCTGPITMVKGITGLIATVSDGECVRVLCSSWWRKVMIRHVNIKPKSMICLGSLLSFLQPKQCFSCSPWSCKL